MAVGFCNKYRNRALRHFHQSNGPLVTRQLLPVSTQSPFQQPNNLHSLPVFGRLLKEEEKMRHSKLHQGAPVRHAARDVVVLLGQHARACGTKAAHHPTTPTRGNRPARPDVNLQASPNQIPGPRESATLDLVLRTKTQLRLSLFARDGLAM